MPQDEFARRSRDRGLPWTRSTVAKIEAGQRDLKAGELLLLPFVLNVAFEDLLPTTKFADIGPDLSKVEAETLRRIVRGYVPKPPPGHHRTPGRAVPAEAEEKAARALGWTIDQVTTRALRRWDLSLTGEREKRLLRKLGGRSVPPRSQQAIRGRITRQLLLELAGTTKEKKL